MVAHEDNAGHMQAHQRRLLHRELASAKLPAAGISDHIPINNLNANSRFFYGWVIAAVAALGIACSFSVLVVTITGIFATPLTHELGWSMQQVFTGPLVAGLSGILVAPFIGALSDRFGARRIVLISFVIEVLVLASFRYLNASIMGYWIRYGALAVLCMGTTQVAFSRIISSWFNRHLGLAIGISLAGVGVGGFGWSLLLQKLIDGYGWRNAYLGMALLIACVTLPALLLLLRDKPSDMGLHIDGQTGSAPALELTRASGGMTLREAAATPQYQLMAVTWFLMGLSMQGAQLHVIPLLLSRGASAQLAAATQAMMLITVILGRVSSGLLLDRFFAPRVAQAFILAPILGIAALTLGASGAWAVIAAMCIGLAVGGESDVIAFLVRRYFGLKQYSRIYGTFFSVFGAGSAIGPAATAWAVAHVSGGYGTVLWFHVGMLIITGLMLFGFRSYSRD
jgi:MFS family permease